LVEQHVANGKISGEEMGEILEDEVYRKTVTLFKELVPPISVPAGQSARIHIKLKLASPVLTDMRCRIRFGLGHEDKHMAQSDWFELPGHLPHW
jgi:hypothetical protein